jgi:hypothetical protein
MLEKIEVKGRRHTIKWKPAEDSAGFDSATYFLDPSIVERHPFRLISSEFAWLDILPEVHAPHVSDAIRI